MSPRTGRILAVLILLLFAALLLVRCTHSPVDPHPMPAPATDKTPTARSSAAPAPAAAAPKPATAEDLSPATVKGPAEVVAGAAFRVEWTGPDNPGDYLTVVPAAASEADYASYAETRLGRSVLLTAPIDAGACEIRYVATRSKKVLGRAAIAVIAASASLIAPAEAVLGSTIQVEWIGPNNEADYITVVPKGTPDGRYDNYTETRKGSPLPLQLLPAAGEAELRYMTGKGARVLARRDLKIIQPETSVNGPEEVIAGKEFSVSWHGPGNPGDYITIVSQGTPDGRYDNYTETRRGSPLQLTALMQPGEAELRYMTGQGAKVLARRPIRIIAAQVALDAPIEVTAGATVSVAWTGPDNASDYITIVRHGTADGQYARYADTSRGSPARVEAPMDVGPAEIRYMSGQGGKVLARRALTITTPRVTLQAPARAAAGAVVAVEWTGPGNRGDYLTIVAKDAKDGATTQTVPTSRGTPARLRTPTITGPAEIRYMSGQNDRVLGRAELELTTEALAGAR